jgi:hypothetical protein
MCWERCTQRYADPNQHTGEFIGMGTTRVVFHYDADSVLKMPALKYMFGDYPVDPKIGTGANYQEVMTYERLRSIDPLAETYLFRVIEVSDDFTMLRMEKAVETLKERYKDGGNAYNAMRVDPQIQALCAWAQKHYLFDVHPGNIGFRADGTVGILDYA